MIQLSLLVFVTTIIATGCLQEVSNSLLKQSPRNDNTAKTKEQWLQQFQGLRQSGKPCRRRSNSSQDESWLPSYSSRSTYPYQEPTVLQPQALKNEDYKKYQVGASNNNDKRNLAPDSYDLITDDDCVDKLEAVTVVGSGTDAHVAKTALKIIEDCIKKKPKDQYISGASRRSMSDPDLINGDNHYPRDSENDVLLDGSKVDDSDDRRSDSSRQGLQDNEQQKLSVTEDRTELANSGRSGNNLQNLRICYACSTASNPTCWEPDKRTTIKYCRKEQYCVTKTFGVKNQVTLIRDCANSCTDTSVPGIEPKYKSCKICHKDYCNSAMSVSINIFSLAIILIISIVKSTN